MHAPTTDICSAFFACFRFMDIFLKFSIRYVDIWDQSDCNICVIKQRSVHQDRLRVLSVGKAFNVSILATLRR